VVEGGLGSGEDVCIQGEVWYVQYVGCRKGLCRCRHFL